MQCCEGLRYEEVREIPRWYDQVDYDYDYDNDNDNGVEGILDVTCSAYW